MEPAGPMPKADYTAMVVGPVGEPMISFKKIAPPPAAAA